MCHLGRLGTGAPFPLAKEANRTLETLSSRFLSLLCWGNEGTFVV